MNDSSETKMAIRSVQHFVTPDGQSFPTEREAQDHVAELKVRASAEAFVEQHLKPTREGETVNRRARTRAVNLIVAYYRWQKEPTA